MYKLLRKNKKRGRAPVAALMVFLALAVTLSGISLTAFATDAAETPNITENPQSATTTYGATADTLSVTVDEPSDGGELSYQWYASDDDSADTNSDSPLGGKTEKTYTPLTTRAGVFYYFVEVTNTTTSAIIGFDLQTSNVSSVAAITVNKAIPEVTLEAAPESPTRPGSVKLTASATGVNGEDDDLTGTYAFSGETVPDSDPPASVDLSGSNASISGDTCVFTPSAIIEDNYEFSVEFTPTNGDAANYVSATSSAVTVSFTKSDQDELIIDCDNGKTQFKFDDDIDVKVSGGGPAGGNYGLEVVTADSSGEARISPLTDVDGNFILTPTRAGILKLRAIRETDVYYDYNPVEAETEILLDGGAPTIGAIEPDEADDLTVSKNHWLREGDSITATITDGDGNSGPGAGVAKVEYSIDGGDNWVSASDINTDNGNGFASKFESDRQLTLTLTDAISVDSAVEIEIRATDEVGNVSDISTEIVKIDNQPPTITLPAYSDDLAASLARRPGNGNWYYSAGTLYYNADGTTNLTIPAEMITIEDEDEDGGTASGPYKYIWSLNDDIDTLPTDDQWKDGDPGLNINATDVPIEIDPDELVPDEENKIYIRAVDTNGNVMDTSVEFAFFYDNTEPTADFLITDTSPWYSRLPFGLFGNHSLRVEVTVSDTASGVDVAQLITDEAITVTLEDGVDGTTTIATAGSAGYENIVEQVDGDTFAFDLSPDPDTGKIDGVLHVSFRDNVGNYNYDDEIPTYTELKDPDDVSDYFMLETNPPEASLVIDETSGAERMTENSDISKKWFAKGDVLRYDVDAADADSGLYKVELSLKDGNGREIDKISPDGGNGAGGVLSKTQTSAGLGGSGSATAKIVDLFGADASDRWHVTVDTANISDVGAGTFTLELLAIDNSGNTLATNPTDVFYVDNAAPVVQSIRFANAVNSVVDTGASDSELVHDGAPNVAVTPYGYFFQSDTVVTAKVTDYQRDTSDDEIAGTVGSSFANVTITATDRNGNVAYQSSVSGRDAETYELAVQAGFKGQITVTATDNVFEASATGNTPSRPAHTVTAHPYGNAIETSAQFDESSSLSIVTDDTPYTETSGQGGHKLYNERYPAGATIEAGEAFAGIRNIDYTRTVPEDGDLTKKSIFSASFDTDSVKGKAESAEIYDIEKTGIFENAELTTENNIGYLYTQATARDEIKAGDGVELSDITLQTVLTSNALHERTVKADPISIDTLAPRFEYTWDNESVENGKYYKDARKITLKVTERNFDPEQSKPVTSGPNVVFSGWRDSGDVHTATVSFSADGDYTFAFKTTDRAGHTTMYKGGAKDEFTVDKTAPVIDVSYDNNSALNDYYYKETRVATITVHEHNFRATEFVEHIDATDNGASISSPSVSGFGRNGDDNTATVSFTYDGDFRASYDYTDLAGNPAEAYPSPADHFVIDLTDPEIEIYDVEDHMAYNGEIAPGIRYSDTNKDESGVSVKWVGVNTGEYTPTFAASSVTDTHVDKKLEDIPRTPEKDDIYTMTAKVVDRSGRSVEKEVVFSVNRFGSTFMVDEDDRAFIDEKDGYLNQEFDLGVTEINVNELVEHDVSVSRDGQVKALADADYSFMSTGTADTWKSYHYEFPAATFADEGEYDILIHSEDEATNVQDNKNNLRGKSVDVKFVIDKTKPSTVISGIEANGRYIDDTKEAVIDATDNILLDKVIVSVDGNENTFEQSDFTDGILAYSLDSANSWQDVHIYSIDKAGNTDKEDIPALRILLTSNVFVQFIRNIPLVVGTIAAIIGVIALVWWLRVGRVRRKDRAV